MTDDPFDLARFEQAQERQYQDALDELRSGRKQTHWIWFVFPQLRALGRSGTARHYGLENTLEARTYWEHPILGRRLQESVEIKLPRPRTLAIKRTPEFVSYVDHIWRLIEDDVRASVIEERV